LPVLCLRDVTERWEGVWEGVEKLVGTDALLITEGMNTFYQMDASRMQPSAVYGDGLACKRIVSILSTELGRHVRGATQDTMQRTSTWSKPLHI
jgi:UDP-N-acetylglucosamine 2-epimerase